MKIQNINAKYNIISTNTWAKYYHIDEKINTTTYFYKVNISVDLFICEGIELIFHHK